MCSDIVLILFKVYSLITSFIVSVMIREQHMRRVWCTFKRNTGESPKDKKLDVNLVVKHPTSTVKQATRVTRRLTRRRLTLDDDDGDDDDSGLFLSVPPLLACPCSRTPLPGTGTLGSRGPLHCDEIHTRPASHFVVSVDL